MIGRRGKLPVSDEPKLKGFDDYDLRLGDVMRGERATLGKSLLDVQRELKVKASYIAAIENSDPSAFETQGFVAGYVRSYARYLGLDPEWAYSRFCAESNFATTDGMTSGAAAKPKKATPRKPAGRDPLADPEAIFIPRPKSVISQVEPSALGSVLVLVMLISALGYGGWSVFREVQKVQFIPVDQTPTGISTNVDVLAADTGSELAVLEDSAAPVPTTEALDRLYRPDPLDVPILAARDGPIGSLTPGELGAIAPRLDQTPGIDDEILADADLGDDLSPVQVIEETLPEVVLFAVRPSWVRVRGADGTVLFEKILDAGEQYVLPQTEEPPLLRAGNAGSVYFAVNGQTIGPAGNGPDVVKNLDLSASSLIASFEAADPAADADLARFFAVAQAD
jgi:cytoskeletal protein RodZ